MANPAPAPAADTGQKVRESNRGGRFAGVIACVIPVSSISLAYILWVHLGSGGVKLDVGKLAANAGTLEGLRFGVNIGYYLMLYLTLQALTSMSRSVSQPWHVILDSFSYVPLIVLCLRWVGRSEQFTPLQWEIWYMSSWVILIDIWVFNYIFRKLVRRPAREWFGKPYGKKAV